MLKIWNVVNIIITTFFLVRLFGFPVQNIVEMFLFSFDC